MRKLLISLAAAGTALAFATPAAAQFYGGAQAYPVQWHRGYNGGYRNVERWDRQIDQMYRQMDQLARSGRLTRAEAIDLRRDLRNVQIAARRSGRGGVAPWEAQQIEQRIQRVRYEIRRYSDYDRGNRRWRR
ncbi:hypothetical protein ACUXST_000395 [Sphingomonas sp. F9_3S_D5_B_2]